MSELQKLEVTKAKLEQISERVYSASYILTMALVIGTVISTALARWYSDNDSIQLIPVEVFTFIKDILWVFVLPVTVKIAGDKLPLVLQIVQAARGMQVSVSQETIQNSQQNQMSQEITGVQNVNNG